MLILVADLGLRSWLVFVYASALVRHSWGRTIRSVQSDPVATLLVAGNWSLVGFLLVV